MTKIMETHLNIILHLHNFFAWLARLWCLVLDIHNHFLIQRCAFCCRQHLHLLPSYCRLLQKELRIHFPHVWVVDVFWQKKWFWSFFVVSKTLLVTYNLTAVDPICPPSTNNGLASFTSRWISLISILIILYQYIDFSWSVYWLFFHITMNQFNQDIDYIWVDFQHFQGAWVVQKLINVVLKKENC